jgi:septal ring factor EnvC (AmiA/AmiB activator)
MARYNKYRDNEPSGWSSPWIIGLILAIVCLGAGIWLNMRPGYFNYAALKAKCERMLMTTEARQQVEELEKKNTEQLEKSKKAFEKEIESLEKRIKQQKATNVKLRKQLEEAEDAS